MKREWQVTYLDEAQQRKKYNKKQRDGFLELNGLRAIVRGEDRRVLATCTLVSDAFVLDAEIMVEGILVFLGEEVGMAVPPPLLPSQRAAAASVGGPRVVQPISAAPFRPPAFNPPSQTAGQQTTAVKLAPPAVVRRPAYVFEDEEEEEATPAAIPGPAGSYFCTPPLVPAAGDGEYYQAPPGDGGERGHPFQFRSSHFDYAG